MFIYLKISDSLITYNCKVGVEKNWYSQLVWAAISMFSTSLPFLSICHRSFKIKTINCHYCFFFLLVKKIMKSFAGLGNKKRILLKEVCAGLIKIIGRKLVYK